MNKRNIIILLSLLVNIVLAYLLLKPEDIDRRPPWHPFEVNSELTLESIVNDGYRFDSAPCGQVQYIKQVRDTVIQYEVEIDCNSYEGYDTSHLEIFEDIEEPLDSVEIEPEIKGKTYEEMIAENKYFPWSLNEIDNCYQRINWRVYTVSLGKRIDSLKLIDYVERKGGRILKSTENWNSKDGGSFMVYNSKTYLYFMCTISYKDYLDENDWKFKIIRSIPALNQKTIREDEVQRKKREEYYNRSYFLDGK